MHYLFKGVIAFVILSRGSTVFETNEIPQ